VACPLHHLFIPGSFHRPLFLLNCHLEFTAEATHVYTTAQYTYTILQVNDNSPRARCTVLNTLCWQVLVRSNIYKCMYEYVWLIDTTKEEIVEESLTFCVQGLVNSLCVSIVIKESKISTPSAFDCNAWIDDRGTYLQRTSPPNSHPMPDCL